MVDGLERNDDYLIGFVSEALISGAINIREAHQWIYNLISKYDNLPTYIYDLPEANNWKEFDKIIGFHAYNTSETEFDALSGIAFVRGNITDEEAISKKKALKALKGNPQLEKRFRETFPFIEF
ncbi:MAG: enterotoxin A family protein [Pseudomonadota bacterium]